MKLRLLLVSALLMLGTTITFAQQPVRYGVKAGVNFANYKARVVDVVDLNTDPVTSFYVSAYADIALPHPAFSVQPGISFQGKGGQLTGSYSTTNNQGQPQTMKATYSERPYFIEIPVNLIGRMDMGNGNNFILGVGPYLAFGVGGEYRIRTSGLSIVDMFGISGDLDYGANGELKSTDFGFNFLLGFELFNGFGVQGGYSLGVTDIGGRKLGVPFYQKNRVFNLGISKTF